MRPALALIALILALPAVACGTSVGTRSPGGEPPRTADERVQRALDALDLSYEIDREADFKLGITMDGGRSQLLYIGSQTAHVGEMELRDVWSYVHQHRGALTQDGAAWLLRRNDQVKLGSFGVITLGDGTSAVVFVVSVDANGSVDDIRAALLAVAETADSAEQRLSSADSF
ncbi:MAG: hypothetical protein CSA66_03815 [Proteobacteria bacterium]|nr:MAG: hypothetical protein CSA66_03815 [Pseudomonadota bacterium]